MNVETACTTLCENITTVLLSSGLPSFSAAFAAGAATRDVVDALHHAAGAPDDVRWNRAVTSLQAFLDICAPLPIADSHAARVLRTFVAENGGNALDTDFVHVAPAPIFAGLERADDGMRGRVKVLCGVTVGRAIATADVAANQALP